MPAQFTPQAAAEAGRRSGAARRAKTITTVIAKGPLLPADRDRIVELLRDVPTMTDDQAARIAIDLNLGGDAA